MPIATAIVSTLLQRIDGMPIASILTSQMATGGADMANPNPTDQCPCGSGKMYKDCCGKNK